ncbi:MAG: WD40/YVTN/BNR-like repeat-containing protein [Burkholderiales bacterium]
MASTCAIAHDPSAWGGIFRSRDFGGSWLAADAGQFIGGALALSIDPKDANHLLFATDTRLLRSNNGGRDWNHEAADKLVGPTTAVSFDGQGSGAVASSAAGVFYTEDGGAWQAASIPEGAAPARMLIAGGTPQQYYLAGPKGVYGSADHGKRFLRLGENALPDAAATCLVLSAQGTLFALAGGELWRSHDQGTLWQASGVGMPAGRVEVVTRSPGGALWAAAADKIYQSTDDGTTWVAMGNPLPEANTSIRGIAVSDDLQVVMLATHRGALRSADGGKTWAQVEGALPVHLEGGLMLRDPHDAQTLYTGFALTPYPEIYRRAQEGNNLLSRTDPVSLAGGIAFLLLLIISGWWLATKLYKGRT